MECGDCTLCCKLTNITSKHGEYCSVCAPSVGCKIYLDRPTGCRIFQCAYSQMEEVKPSLRPDKCGVLFEKINNSLMLGTTNSRIGNIPMIVNGQIKSFVSEGISVMMQQFNPHVWICNMVKGADKNEIIKALEDKANDSSKLH